MEHVKRFFSKSLRLVAIFALIYLCMLFYMAVSERRYAFPRAPSDEASAKALAENAVLCEAPDGKKLEGWILNDSLPNTVLYFADAGEDASTFLRNASKISSVRMVAFNYRGSAGSEGTPGEKFYAEDIGRMIACSGGEPKVLLGHGVGAIAAYNFQKNVPNATAILVDPAESYTARLSNRYRIFFPKFLGRSKTRMEFSPEDAGLKKATVVLDDPRREPLSRELLEAHPDRFEVVRRSGASLLDVLDSLIEKSCTN